MDLFKVGSNIQSMQALNNLYKLNEKMSVISLDYQLVSVLTVLKMILQVFQ